MELFPHAAERDAFITHAIEDALAQDNPDDSTAPIAVGGTLHLFSDGGSRGNPGEAAIAYILEDPVRGAVLQERSFTIGVQTNNVAEYRALIEGLRAARKYQPNRLICHLDSELAVRQLNGEYQVKMPSLKAYVDDIQELARALPDVVFTFIPRADNYRADALVNKALDAEAKKKRLPPTLRPRFQPPPGP